MADRRLELDQRVSLVVFIGRAGFTVGAEVEIVTNGTLVADTTNIGRRSLRGTAQGTVTANAIVNGMCNIRSVEIGERLVDSSEAMAGVHKVRVLDTFSAIVPVGAVETLVANASDVLGRN